MTQIAELELEFRIPLCGYDHFRVALDEDSTEYLWQSEMLSLASNDEGRCVGDQEKSSAQESMKCCILISVGSFWGYGGERWYTEDRLQGLQVYPQRRERLKENREMVEALKSSSLSTENIL